MGSLISIPNTLCKRVAPKSTPENSIKASTTLGQASTTLTTTGFGTILDNAFCSSEFQYLIAYDNLEMALQFAQSIRSLKQLDCKVCLLPRNTFPSVLHAWATNISKSNPSKATLSKTLAIIHAAGGVTRETVNAFDETGESCATILGRSNWMVLEMLIDLAPGVVDFNANSKRGLGRTALMRLLLVTGYIDKSFTKNDCLLFDRLSARCVKLVVDPFCFNVADSSGWCALTIAVTSLRVETLRALLRCIPAISIEPELDLVRTDGEPAFSLDVAMKARHQNPLPNEEKDRNRVGALIAAARSCLCTYRQSLESVIRGALPNVPPDICAIIRAYTDRPAAESPASTVPVA